MEHKYKSDDEHSNNKIHRSIPSTVYIDDSNINEHLKKQKYSCSSNKKNNLSMISDSIHVSRPYKNGLNIDETEQDISQYSIKSNSMCYSNEKSAMKGNEFGYSQKVKNLNINSLSKLQRESMAYFESNQQCINEKSASKLKMLNNMLSEEKSSKNSTENYNNKFKLLEDQNKMFIHKLEEIEYQIKHKDKQLISEKSKNEEISEKQDKIIKLIETSIENKMEIVKSNRNEEYMLADTGRPSHDKIS